MPLGAFYLFFLASILFFIYPGASANAPTPLLPASKDAPIVRAGRTPPFQVAKLERSGACLKVSFGPCLSICSSQGRKYFLTCPQRCYEPC